MILVPVLVILSIHLLVVESSCPDGFVHHGSHCYHFSHDKEAYGLAELICEQMSAHLATVETAAESAFLSGQVLTKNSDHYYIGLNDILEEGVWRWLTTGANLSTNLSNWDAHEPNNSNPGLENCVVIKTDGKWGDEVCMHSHFYICEMPDEQTEIVG